jgi:hypothetical protein
MIFHPFSRKTRSTFESRSCGWSFLQIRMTALASSTALGPSRPPRAYTVPAAPDEGAFDALGFSRCALSSAGSFSWRLASFVGPELHVLADLVKSDLG